MVSLEFGIRYFVQGGSKIYLVTLVNNLTNRVSTTSMVYYSHKCHWNIEIWTNSL